VLGDQVERVLPSLEAGSHALHLLKLVLLPETHPQLVQPEVFPSRRTQLLLLGGGVLVEDLDGFVTTHAVGVQQESVGVHPQTVAVGVVLK